MRGGKKLTSARVNGQARSSDDGQTRRRHRPAIGVARACELDHAEVRRCVQVARDIVVGDAVDRLIADLSAGALKICPSRSATDRIIRHQEDMAGLWCLSCIQDELVVAQVRHIRAIRIHGIDRNAADSAVRRVGIETVDSGKRHGARRIGDCVLGDEKTAGCRGSPERRAVALCAADPADGAS